MFAFDRITKTIIQMLDFYEDEEQITVIAIHLCNTIGTTNFSAIVIITLICAGIGILFDFLLNVLNHDHIHR